MRLYDQAEFHAQDTKDLGQPEANAFTHAVFWMMWLIERGLHDRAAIDVEGGGEPPLRAWSRVPATMNGALASNLMNDLGRDFTDARYDSYVEDYARTFGDHELYGVEARPRSYARIAPRIAALFDDWDAKGRPPPPRRVIEQFERSARMARAVRSAAPVRGPQTQEQFHESLTALATQMGATVSMPPRSHDDPELEALLPTDFTDPPLSCSSSFANRWGDRRVSKALKTLGIRSRDATVASGFGIRGESNFVFTFYRVRGVDAEKLLSAFEPVVRPPRGVDWKTRMVGTKAVLWSEGRDGVSASWTVEGLLISLKGNASVAEAAVALLPGQESAGLLDAWSRIVSAGSERQKTARAKQSRDPDRPRLERSLAEILAPVLRADGFKGSGRNYRRVLNGLVETLDVQSLPGGAAFAINLGVHPVGVPDAAGRTVDPKTVVGSHCELTQRLSETGRDRWWSHRFDRASMDAAVRLAVQCYEQHGRPRLEAIARDDSDLLVGSAAKFAERAFDLQGFLRMPTLPLLLARLRSLQGQAEEAVAFARHGLERVDEDASILRARLQAVIDSNARKTSV